MKALIVGTSNCLLEGGFKNAINEFFGPENVTNLSLGASSGTFLALFRLMEGVDFQSYDYVFFDSLVNEQWQFASGRCPSYLWQVARMFYGSLPAGVTYVYVGFCAQPFFTTGNPIELLHRSLCGEFGINFVSFRDVLNEFIVSNALTSDSIYIASDPSHFILPIVRRLTGEMLQRLDLLSAKTQRGRDIKKYLFIDNVVDQAPNRKVYQTSLRSMEYGIFENGSRIKLRSGTLLGFDHCELDTEAYLWVYGRHFLQKALHFRVDKPWMKMASFNREVPCLDESYAVVSAEPYAGIPVEHTDGTVPLEAPMSGQAKISNMFYSKLQISDILTLVELDRASRIEFYRDNMCRSLVDHMREHRDEFKSLARSTN
ncbi:hypothetical protein [Methylobacterium sp. SyP6R]|uniref:hypothetical protein n=1 Tax=Methylobacterium sp. SyP6R TaxID=2718876 RepID=UPI001F401BBD|nr:hypothetical protein [Methylobacterium sp. SyP6R]MCF4127303.1 hypothetical protein [Methylobacterium sp. SyP6R]